MKEPRSGPKRWHPYPSWWYAIGGGAAVTMTAIGLKYVLNGPLRLHDVLSSIVGGTAWLVVSACLGWVNHRGLDT